MSDKDQIKELFSDKLGGYEAKVNPELWSNIASQVGTVSSVVGGTGLSLVAKFAIGISAACVVTITTIAIVNSNTDEKEVNTKEKNVEKLQPMQSSPSNTVAAEFVTEMKHTSIEEETNSLETESQDVNTRTEHSVLPIEPQEGLTREDDPTVDLRERVLNTEVNTNSEEINNSTTQESSNSSEVTVEESENVQNTETNINEKDFTLPNVFSPNGDNIQDELFIEKIEDYKLKDFYVVVINQNSNRVYESNDPNFKWDGRHMITGDFVPQGTYVYFITATDSNGMEVKKSQYLTIYSER